MRHVHLSRELWQAISEGRCDQSDLANLACEHLMELCPTCKEEFEAFRCENDQGGNALAHMTAVSEAMEWAQVKAREVTAERRAARPKLAALLALPESEWRSTVENTPENYQGLVLAQMLIEESRACMLGSSRKALALAELASVLFAHEPSSPLVIESYARATGHMANALRVQGKLLEASRLLHSSRFMMRYEGETDRLLQAEMDHFEGALRRDQRRFDEAEFLFDRAVSTYRDQNFPVLGAQVLLDIGVMHKDLNDGVGAAQAAGKALRLLDPSQEPRLCFIARHNLADGLCEQGDYEAATQQLVENEPFARKYADELSLLRIAWVEGKIARGCGDSQGAESSLLVARYGFLKHGIAYESAQVSLELSLLYLQEGRGAEVKRLAAEMVAVFEEEAVHREATAALILFRDAAELERVSAPHVRQMMIYLAQSRRDASFSFQVAS